MTEESGRPPDGNESTGADGTVRAQYDWTSISPTTAVIETVAIAVDREPTTLEALYESVDPDALNALVHSRESSTRGDTVRVSFVFSDHHVSVDGTGEIVVRTVASDR